MTVTPVPRLFARERGGGIGVPSSRGRRLRALLAQRLVQMPLVLLAVSVLTFWLVQIVPGNPGRNALGPYATAEQVVAWNEKNGLTGDVFERYLRWLGGFLTGDWGQSFTLISPVRDVIGERLLNSAFVGLYAFVLMVPIAIILGSVQAYRAGRRSDRSITVALMALAAVPEFVIGVVLLVVFAVWFPVVPVQASGTIGDGFGPRLAVATLPAITLAISSLAVLTRTVRTGVSLSIRAPYHRTAVLKGLPTWLIVRRHVTRNALVPTVSQLGMYLGGLLGGSAVIEFLFNYPGLGITLVNAAQRKDVALLTSGVMVTGIISLLALLLADIVLTLMDPRIRFDNRED